MHGIRIYYYVIRSIVILCILLLSKYNYKIFFLSYWLLYYYPISTISIYSIAWQHHRHAYYNIILFKFQTRFRNNICLLTKRFLCDYIYIITILIITTNNDIHCVIIRHTYRNTLLTYDSLYILITYTKQKYSRSCRPVI